MVEKQKSEFDEKELEYEGQISNLIQEIDDLKSQLHSTKEQKESVVSHLKDSIFKKEQLFSTLESDYQTKIEELKEQLLNQAKSNQETAQMNETELEVQKEELNKKEIEIKSSLRDLLNDLMVGSSQTSNNEQRNEEEEDQKENDSNENIEQLVSNIKSTFHSTLENYCKKDQDILEIEKQCWEDQISSLKHQLKTESSQSSSTISQLQVLDMIY